MAIFNHGIFSKARKKLGGAVFQQYEGLQVGREYQPVVKNPNTEKQIAARAKFKLASQMVALYNQVLLIVGAKISIYSRYIRGAFVGAISRAAEFNTDTAVIKIDAFAQAINTRVGFSEIPAPVIAGDSAQNATITATLGDVVTYEVVAYDEQLNILGTSEETYTSDASAHTVELPRTATTPYYYDIVAVATRATTENGAAVYDNIAADYAVDVARLVAAGDVATSNIATAQLPQA